MYDFTQTFAIYYFHVHCFYSCEIIAVTQLRFRLFMTSDIIQIDDKILSDGIFYVTPQELYALFCFFLFCGGLMAIAWLRHQMETCSVLLALCEGNPSITSGFRSKSQWREDLMFSSIHAWANGWANNRDTGDIRRHRAHSDVTVMWFYSYSIELFHVCLALERSRHCFWSSNSGTSLKDIDC